MSLQCERSADAIALLPESEREEILAEQGDITMIGELCGETYRFGREVYRHPVRITPAPIRMPKRHRKKKKCVSAQDFVLSTEKT